MASSLVDTPRSSSASSMSPPSSLYTNNPPQRRMGNTLFKSAIPRSIPSVTCSSPMVQLLRPISPTLAPVQFLRQFKPPSDKPRWNGSTNTRGSSTGHTFTPDSFHHHSTASSPRSIASRSPPSKIPAPRSFSHNVDPMLSRAKSPTTPAYARHVSTPAASPRLGRAHSSLGNLPPPSPYATRTPSSLANRPSLGPHTGRTPSSLGNRPSLGPHSGPHSGPPAVRTPSSLGNRLPRLAASSNPSQPRAFTTPSSTRRNDFLAPASLDESDAETDWRSEAKRTARAPSALAIPNGRKSAMRSPSRTADIGGGGRYSRADGRLDSQIGKPRWK
jgi:hypothetical protein